MDVEPLVVSLAAAAVGAVLGGAATWFASHRVERSKRRSSELQAVQEKIHTLDVRMTWVETKMEVYGATARRKTSGLEREQRHDGQG